MDRSLIKSMMPSLVAGHVPRNVRSFKYRVFDDQPLSSTLGFAIDPQPFDGKVVAATDDAIVVKLKPSEFAVLDPNLVTTVPSRRRQGACPTLCPSSLRRTARGHAGGHHREDFGRHAVHHHEAHPRLGAGQAAHSRAAVHGVGPAHRAVGGDAGARSGSGASPTCWWMPVRRDFTWVDPTPSKIIETPPAISFTVSTAKFEGRVTILYDRGGDTYVVELHRQNGESVELVDRHDEVYFDMLGEVLERLIDDGRWRQIDVSILDAKAARKRQAVPA
jgi:hypothetical protein